MRQSIYAAILLGALAGSLLINIYGQAEPDFLQVFSVSTSEWQTAQAEEVRTLFVLLLSKRMLQLIVLVLAGVLFRSTVLHLGMFFVSGVLFGALMSAQIMFYGLKGCLVACALWLPQWVFYGAVLAILFYFLQTVMQDIRSAKRIFLRRFAMVMLACTALTALGCYTEARIHPILFLNVTQYFVGI